VLSDAMRAGGERGWFSRSKLLTYGFVGVAVTEAVSFGASACKFLKIDTRIDQILAVQTLLKPELNCPNCQKPLDYYLLNNCGYCGTPTLWPRKFFRTANTTACFRCKFPLQVHQAFCSNCGQQRPIQVAFTLNGQNSKS
jgi:predicted amidophosphoribosyltransferase